MKKRKFIKNIFALIMLFINLVLISSNVNAANIGESKTLERGEKGYYCVQKWDGSKWVYLSYNQTFYTDNDGQKYIAYCLSPGSPGVGYVSGESESYDVKINKMLDDERIWRVLKNGYPNKSIKQLNLENADDAYFATMQAINAILRGYNLEQAKELYSVGKFAINNENYEDIQRRGNKTLKAMYNLIDIGLNGSETRNQYLSISIQKETNLIKENEKYYSQTFKVKSLAEISEYNVVKLEGMPKGTYIADSTGKEKQNFKANESFKVMIPTNQIVNDIKGNIEIKAKQKNYPVYFGEASLQGFQNYALCNNSYSDAYAKTDINIKTDISELKIIKVDEENKNPIEGVTFKITTSNGKASTYKTDENGVITIKNQKPGSIIVQEIETVGNYKIDSKERNIVLNYDEKKEVVFENRLQKGNIKIIKVDKDNNEIKLQGVKFEVRNATDDIVREGITDENGEIFFDNLVIGEYKIKEVETDKEYELLNEEIPVTVADNEISSVVIENQRKKEVPKIVKTIIKPKEVEKIVKVEKEKKVEKIVEKRIVKETEKQVEKKIIKENKIEVANKELPKTGVDKRMKNIVFNCIIISYVVAFIVRKMMKKVDR